MRKLVLIAAITLVASTTANAGPSRSLSLASTEPSPPATEQPTTQTADTPAGAVERPKTAAPPEPAKAPIVAHKPDETAKPKKKHASTEARIIYELHRHGVYW